MAAIQHFTLSDLAIGALGRVVGYGEESAYTANLRRLGLVPGTEFELIRRAPLGDPIEIRFRGFALALRAEEAIQVHVEALQ